MSILVAYKYAANPQDASVNADGTLDWSRAKKSVSEYDPVAAQVGRDLADALGTELVGISVGAADIASGSAKKNAMILLYSSLIRDFNPGQEPGISLLT